MRKQALTIALALVLILLAALPFIYPYLSSLLTPTQAIAPEGVNPNSVPNLPLSPSALLGYANVILESAQAGNFTRAQNLTLYLNDLPPTIEHNLLTYLQQITELVSIIKSVKDGLDALTLLMANGQITQAEGLISKIDSGLSDASTRLGTLYEALDRIASIYNINVSAQRGRLDGLASILAQFKQLLQSLEASLQKLDTRTATRLMISVRPNPIWTNGTLHISGLLEQSNGTGLRGRVVELWVNATRIRQISSGKEGSFTWTYDAGASRYSTLAIYARYIPTGNDANHYRPTVSDTVIVPVRFYGATLTVLPYNTRVYVTETFSIQGSLANLVHEPLPKETIVLMVDGKPAGSIQTDTSGGYVLSSSFPQGTIAGNHRILVAFNPASGVYGSTGVAVGMQVYYMASSVTVTSGRPNFTLSGQTITLGGRVTVEAQPFSKGWIIAFMGGSELGRVPVGEGGIFQLPISIPIDASGQNALTIIFSPEEPWILSNQASVELNVMNSGLVGFASIGLVAAVAMLSTRNIEPTPTQRAKRRERRQRALEQLHTETVPAPVTIHLARLGAFTDPRRRVQETYWESRRAIAEALHETALSSETHREFASRLKGKLGKATTPFSLLTLLFEVAAYSEHEITERDAQAALVNLILMAERLNISKKLEQTWSQFRTECEAKANETLDRLGISEAQVAIKPEAVTVQLPWDVSKEKREVVSKSLDTALRMPINLVPIRYCDSCKYKLEGSAVELETCPECGTRLTHEPNPTGEGR